MTINYKKLGQKLKKMRIENNLTQENLAELCDLSTSYVSYIETGKRKLSFKTLEVLSKYLKFEIELIDEDKKKELAENRFYNRLKSFIKKELEPYNINW